MILNRLSDVTKIIIFAGTIVVICVLCALGFKMANEGKSAVTSGTRKYNEMAANQDDTELEIYDGSTILGNELVNIIKRTIDSNKHLAVYVRNKTTSVSYNYIFDVANKTIVENGIKIIPQNPGDYGYINPDSQYLCSIIKSEDNVIICMDFGLIK